MIFYCWNAKCLFACSICFERKTIPMMPSHVIMCTFQQMTLRTAHSHALCTAMAVINMSLSIFAHPSGCHHLSPRAFFASTPIKMFHDHRKIVPRHVHRLNITISTFVLFWHWDPTCELILPQNVSLSREFCRLLVFSLIPMDSMNVDRTGGV